MHFSGLLLAATAILAANPATASAAYDSGSTAHNQAAPSAYSGDSSYNSGAGSNSGGDPYNYGNTKTSQPIPATAGLRCRNFTMIKGSKLGVVCEPMMVVWGGNQSAASVDVKLVWSEDEAFCQRGEGSNHQQLLAETVDTSGLSMDDTRKFNVSHLTPQYAGCGLGCLATLVDGQITSRNLFAIDCLEGQIDLSITVVPQPSHTATLLADAATGRVYINVADVLSSVSVSVDMGTSGKSELEALDAQDWGLSAGCWVRSANHSDVSKWKQSPENCGPVNADPLICDEPLITQFRSAALSPAAAWNLDLAQEVTFGSGSIPMNGPAQLICRVDFMGDFAKKDSNPCNNFFIANITVHFPAEVKEVAGVRIFLDPLGGFSGLARVISPNREATFFRFGQSGMLSNAFEEIREEHHVLQSYGTIVGLTRAYMMAAHMAKTIDPNSACPIMDDNNKRAEELLTHQNVPDNRPAVVECVKQANMNGSLDFCSMIVNFAEQRRCPDENAAKKMMAFQMSYSFQKAERDVCDGPMQAKQAPQEFDRVMHCAYYRIAEMLRTRTFARKIMSDILPERMHPGAVGMMMGMLPMIYGRNLPMQWLTENCPGVEVMTGSASPIGGFTAVENGTLYLGVPGPSFGKDQCWFKAAVITCDKCAHNSGGYNGGQSSYGGYNGGQSSYGGYNGGQSSYGGYNPSSYGSYNPSSYGSYNPSSYGSIPTGQ